MSKRGLYQPRIHDEQIRRLYHLAKRHKVRMTVLLNLIVATAIEDLEQPDESDQNATTALMAEGAGCRVLKTRVAAHDYPRRVKHRNHDRRPTRHANYVRHLRKCKEVQLSGGHV